MKCIFIKVSFLFIFLVLARVELLAQQKKTFKNQIGLSIPFIWSRSEATYYSLGAPKYPAASNINYGIALNYSREIYQGLFGAIGLGYFKQRFSLKRPFDYTTPDNTKPLVHTRYYTYYNIYWTAGIGYKKSLTKKLSAKGIISFNSFNSHRQKYSQNYLPRVNETYKKNLHIGEMLNLDAGVIRNISTKISVGANIILPLYTHWNNDKIFINNFYSASEQQIAKNKFSIGASVSSYYYF